MGISYLIGNKHFFEGGNINTSKISEIGFLTSGLGNIYLFIFFFSTAAQLMFVRKI